MTPGSRMYFNNTSLPGHLTNSPICNECMHIIVALAKQLGPYILTFNNLIEQSLEGYPQQVVQKSVVFKQI